MAGKKEGEEPGGRNRQQEEKGGRRKETVRGERFGIVSRCFAEGKINLLKLSAQKKQIVERG